MPDWTPRDLPGLGLWLRADAATTVTNAEGQVLLWLDARTPRWRVRLAGWLYRRGLLWRVERVAYRVLGWVGGRGALISAPWDLWHAPTVIRGPVHFDGVDDALDPPAR